MKELPHDALDMAEFREVEVERVLLAADTCVDEDGPYPQSMGRLIDGLRNRAGFGGCVVVQARDGTCYQFRGVLEATRLTRVEVEAEYGEEVFAD